ncbi:MULTISPECIES: sugar phosphate nucleotidyltransferase [Weeksella]|uniref:Nucleotidyl transferase n=1 Tax=Weeksella virosa (strain ATCC 43766 / DSM 16922 / JCM 21250 / CCUG 30538 / CDC 9751 / IAM 14551 / NBRC 16016 / NCTC 11634 / CL345/78) TaxID=865938 RepID=F0P2L7_WEEVC|nr:MULTISPECIES: sugar phosphate nucleotidyltransferase [Weeksella]ADX67856.1 Nucleotidyl transferase [Weeksella virosa DSM 16922]MDK7674457.1 sugar phosphate nucleotidyltransferase [Weeksella virosa]OFM82823.1 nucleotidyltransferase [Weeksella sp. HMSC059D05]SUP54159.1 UTP--glucose-1-phosphate uridylyltransferase [Weeksella virosa]VEH64517.1 UTP--glucose-1-phosphate uridylyltransferase [Weeksella virosa]
MKIIIPMAGRGSRLRPHTLTTPKPLIPIAGKPIVHRLAEDIHRLSSEAIDEIAFVIGDFGEEVEKNLLQIAQSLGAKGSIYRQEEPLGTAHAIWMAKEAMDGPVVVAFADTLFQANFELDTTNDGVVWVKQVENPSAFGVVKLDNNGFITDFIEKPKEFVSDLAIIGIYFFKDGQELKNEIRYLIDNNIMKSGEYQLTDALENMRAKGKKFTLGKVDEWMDCGNKTVTVETNSKVLGFCGEFEIPSSAKITNSLIIQPCFIGENVIIEDSKVGPNVSLGNGTKVIGTNIENSLVQENAVIENAHLTESMIGNNAEYYGLSRSISLGDYSVIDFKLQ